jgi:V/A-type H+-transporting ATPase subunit I
VIGRMEKFFITGPKKLAPAILLSLQQAAVVHIDPLRAEEMKEYQLGHEEETRLRRWEAVAASADHALRLLGLEPDQSVPPFADDEEEAEAACSPFEQKAALLVKRREQLRDEIELIHQYREIIGVLAEAGQDLDQSLRLAVLPFLLKRRTDSTPLEQELASTLNGRFLLVGKPVESEVAAMLVVLRREVVTARGILSHHGLAELPRPGEYAEMNLRMMASRLSERSRLAPRELAASEKDLAQLTREAATELQGLRNRAKDESLRLRTLKEMASGRYGFALFGWTPVRLKGRAKEAVDPFDSQTLHTFEPVDEHREADRIPVTLENPHWVKPFESLVTFLNTPRYDSWDPTWVVASFLPLWFGMIVGDIGYALLFAALSWYLSGYIRQNRTLKADFFKMRLTPGALQQVVRVMRPMIVWTVFWGFLHGEFFGNLFERLGIFGTAYHPGPIPVLLPRTDTVATAKQLILVSIGFGACQVLYGLYLKVFLADRQAEKRRFWEAMGYFCGVAALVLFSYAFMTRDFRVWFLIPTVVGAAFFFVGMIRARMPLMIAELPTQAGHILSYIRIYAVGLASAILADLATDIGFSLYHSLGVAGLLFGAIAGLIIHLFLVILLTASHFLQPIRLIWVEFFTKFDFYMTSGRPYDPFRLVSHS